jgi:acyl-[acyl carrier protein]--UDP-N-acetylglucosamine O-acyltransferase
VLEGDLKTVMAGGEQAARNYHGHPCRYDNRRVLANRTGLAGHRQAPQDRPALHGNGLSADA